MLKKIILILLLILNNNCSYKPVLATKNYDFQIININYQGEDYVNKEIKKKLILAGPILDKNNKPIGTVLILDFDKTTDLKKFLNGDPYSKVHLFDEVKITKFKKVI